MNEERRLDRHDRKLLALGVPDPRCQDCGNDRVPALRRLGDGVIKCANCKKGYGPMSPTAANRKLARFAKAGYGDPKCTACGLDCLRVLNLHHIAGEANSTLGAPLCENCHALVSDSQEDLPTTPDLRLRDLSRDPHLKLAAMLEGVAIFFGLLMIALFAWAAWNRAAATELAAQFGPDYWHVITSAVPR
jgi:ribosomal protein L37AE/L43A